MGRIVACLLSGAALLAPWTMARAQASLSPSSLAFAAQTVGTSGTVGVTFHNGPSNIAVNPGTTSSFTVSPGTCPSVLAANQSCTMIVSFAPTVAGNLKGTLTAGGVTAALSGTATPPTGATPETFSPATLTFPPQNVGSTVTQSLVFNSGGTAVELDPVASGGFAVSLGTCSNVIAANTSCVLAVSFTPTAGGAASGTLSAGLVTASLAGSGIATSQVPVPPVALWFLAAGLVALLACRGARCEFA